MTNIAIQSGDLIIGHCVCAAQVAIPGFRARGELAPLIAVALDIRIRAPSVLTAPIGWPAIVTIIDILKLARDRFVTIQGGTFFDLFLGQISDDVLVIIIDVDQRIR